MATKKFGIVVKPLLRPGMKARVTRVSQPKPMLSKSMFGVHSSEVERNRMMKSFNALRGTKLPRKYPGKG